MKKQFSVILTLLLLISCGQSEIDLSQISTRNGLAYQVNKDKPFTGKVVKKMTNEQVIISGSYKDGKKDGGWLEYYNNGQKRKIENYSNGVYDGIVEKYLKNGTKKSHEKYKNNKLNGKCEYFSNTGILLKSAEYSNNKLNGNYIENYVSGNPKIKTFYKNNRVSSNYLSYYENGNKKLEYTINKGNYKGNYIEYNDDGTTHKHYFYVGKNKINRGTWKKYWKNSTPIKKSNNDYSIVSFDKKGKPKTPVKFYYRNGKIKSEGYYSSIEPDIKEGKHIAYYDDGNIKLEGSYNDNMRDGIWKLFYRAKNMAGSKLCQIVEYRNGKYNGKFEWYNIMYSRNSGIDEFNPFIIYKYGRKFHSGFKNSTGNGGRWWKVEGQLKDGKFDGIFKIWDRNWGEGSRPKQRYKKHKWENGKMIWNGDQKYFKPNDIPF